MGMAVRSFSDGRSISVEGAKWAGARSSWSGKGFALTTVGLPNASTPIIKISVIDCPVAPTLTHH
jgi:hypothetical protein